MSAYERKILSGDELTDALERDRRAGRRIVFTNGCFDLMHAGHLHLLGFARAQGDRVVVGLNGDRSVRALKGAGRPINQAGDRARMLAALDLVDYVVVFDETRAERVIRNVRPDILVKGEDYRGQVVDGQRFVESYGGQVVLAPLLEGHSTTSTVAQMRGTGTGASGTHDAPKSETKVNLYAFLTLDHRPGFRIPRSGKECATTIASVLSSTAARDQVGRRKRRFKYPARRSSSGSCVR